MTASEMMRRPTPYVVDQQQQVPSAPLSAASSQVLRLALGILVSASVPILIWFVTQGLYSVLATTPMQ